MANSLGLFPVLSEGDNDAPERVSGAWWRSKGAKWVSALVRGAAHIEREFRGDPDKAFFLIEDSGFCLHTLDADRLEELADHGRGFCRSHGNTDAMLSVLQVDLLEAFIELRIRVDTSHEGKKATILALPVGSEASACRYYRMTLPYERVNAAGNVFVDTQMDAVTLDDALLYDALVIQRHPTRGLIELARRAKCAGVKIVYEADDLMTEIPADNPASLPATQIDLIKRAIGMADLVMVSTEQLADAFGVRDKTVVTLNSLPLSLWKRAQRLPDDDTVNIVWSGGSTHESDLAILDSIWEFLIGIPRVHLTFMGLVPNRLCVLSKLRGDPPQIVISKAFHGRVTYVPWTPIRFYPSVYRELRPDIVLAPMVDDRFSRCKSNLRVLESWALGVPVVASPSGPYNCINDGVDGFHCSGRNEWKTVLRMLIDGAQRRKDVGDAGRARVEAEYDIARNYQRWEDAFAGLGK